MGMEERFSNLLNSRKEKQSEKKQEIKAVVNYNKYDK